MIEEPEYRVSGLQVGPEGVTISYVRMRDVKENGVMFQRTVTIPHRADYDDEIEQLAEAIHTLIADVEDDENVLEPMDFEGSDEDRDDDGDQD